MKLSVVIPALDEADRIAEAVASAAAGGAEILVVDGGSRDGTPGKARAAGARVLASSAGRARQLGIGTEVARGDVVIFLHADTTLPPGWDAAVREALSDPHVAGGAFRFALREGGASLRFIEFGARLRAALGGLPYGDQAFFARRSVLDAIGGVPDVPIMEDLDLARAVRRRGKLALLALPATTSGRRYRDRGPLRQMLRNWVATLGFWLGVDRTRIARWYRR